MKMLSFMLMVGVALLATPALAVDASQTTSAGFSIDIGQALTGSLTGVINGVVTAVLTAGVGWILWLVKQKFGLDVDQKYRDALTAFLSRQASSLIASGAVKLEGVKVNVQNAALASAANMALKAIPDTLAHFNLTPDKIEQMIVDLIPKQPAVASAQAVALDAANPATPDAKG